MMDITCKFQATRSDIYKASKFYYSNGLRKWIWGTVGVISLLLGLRIIAQGNSIGVGVFLICYSAFVFLIPAVNAHFVTRNYCSNPNLGGPMEYHLTDEHMSSNSNLGASTVEWKMFTKWAESPEAFLLIIHRNYYVIALKRGFGSEREIGEFRDFLVSRVGKREF